MLAEMQAVALGTTSYSVLTQTFLDLAEQALSQGQTLKGAYYLRTAEFFLPATDARKQSIRQRFVQLVLRHFVLRWLLHSRHVFPWHAQSFLNNAIDGILLQRVGGGYSFIHRLLLEYFANLDERNELSLTSVTHELCTEDDTDPFHSGIDTG